ncbi:hypothetical protein D1871_17745 [Nakamurella silvestris]|nr:hypothetical protein D1871_17745 [Nakamurella silvestris]
MSQHGSEARTSVGVDLIDEWMASLQVRWLPRHPADRPLEVANPDHERLVAAVPAWAELLRGAVTDPHGSPEWNLDPADPRSVQVVDAYFAGFALALGSALRIPPDPDIEDSQPIVLATAVMGAAAMVERLEIFPELAERGSPQAELIWGTELATATAAAGIAVDLGSNRGSLVEVIRGAATVAADVTDGHTGPGYQVAVILTALADVIDPPTERDEGRHRYEIGFRVDLPGTGLEEAAAIVRGWLEPVYRVGNVLELDVEPRPGGDGYLVSVLTRQAGPVVQALYDHDRPEELRIEVR